MTEDLILTKEFIDELKLLLKSVSIKDTEKMEDVFQTWLLFQCVNRKVDKYEKALNKRIKEIEEDFESDYEDIIRQVDDFGDIYYGLPYDKFSRVGSEISKDVFWFKAKKALGKCHNSCWWDEK